MDRPVERDNKGENDANCARFDDRTKGLVVVYVMFLRKTTENPPSFVVRKRTVGIELVSEYPFTANKICTRRFAYQKPSFVLK
jgi:hypothetical protein